MKPGRNPRRAYDSAGNEIRPPTIRDHKADGYRTLSAYCQDCGHGAVVDVTPFPGRLPVPDVALKLKCSACGSKDISVMLTVLEHYEKMRKEYGWSVGL